MHLIPHFRHNPYLIAQLGAEVEDDVSASTTHVVAGMDGTDKVHWGRRHGKHVVTSAWLQQSGALHSNQRQEHGLIWSSIRA